MNEAAWEVLGVAANASASEIAAARRHLAATHHPDRGGRLGDMQAVNAAAAQMLAALDSGSRAVSAGSPRPRRRPERDGDGAAATDHPSFVVEALPSEVFEALLLVIDEIGTLVDDDPPYRVEFVFDSHGDVRGWCQVTLVPDAGATTASLRYVGDSQSPGVSVSVSVEQVRDVLVAALNRLDWRQL